MELEKRSLGDLLDVPGIYGRRCIKFKDIPKAFMDIQSDGFNFNVDELQYVDEDTYDKNLIVVEIKGKRYTVIIIPILTRMQSSKTTNAKLGFEESRGISDSELYIYGCKLSKEKIKTLKIFPDMFAHGKLSISNDSPTSKLDSFRSNDCIIVEHLKYHIRIIDFLLSENSEQNRAGYGYWIGAFKSLETIHKANCILSISSLHDIFFDDNGHITWIEAGSFRQMPVGTPKETLTFLKLVDIHKLLFDNDFFLTKIGLGNRKRDYFQVLYSQKSVFQFMEFQKALLPSITLMNYDNTNIKKNTQLMDLLSQCGTPSDFFSVLGSINIEQVSEYIQRNIKTCIDISINTITSTKLPKVIKTEPKDKTEYFDSTNSSRFTTFYPFEVKQHQIYFYEDLKSSPIFYTEDDHGIDFFIGHQNITDRFIHEMPLQTKDGYFLEREGNPVFFTYDKSMAPFNLNLKTKGIDGNFKTLLNPSFKKLSKIKSINYIKGVFPTEPAQFTRIPSFPDSEFYSTNPQTPPEPQAPPNPGQSTTYQNMWSTPKQFQYTPLKFHDGSEILKVSIDILGQHTTTPIFTNGLNLFVQLINGSFRSLEDATFYDIGFKSHDSRKYIVDPYRAKIYKTGAFVYFYGPNYEQFGEAIHV